MLSRRVAAVALVLATIVAGAPSAAAPQNTTRDQLMFFNVSLRLVRASTYAQTGLDWRAAFRQASRYPHRPDVFAVLEAPYHKRARIMEVIEAKLGANYGSIHSDVAISACRRSTLSDRRRVHECGNTMVVFRSARFDRLCPGCAVKRWVPLNQQGGPCAIRGNATHVIVRIRDQAQDKIVTVAPIHFDPGLSLDCLARNLVRLNNLMEKDDPWRNRPLTFVTGDFNEHPDPRHDDAGADIGQWRRETRKACWYKRFSALDGDDSCTAGSTGADWSFPYIDAIATKHSGDADAICRQWTYNNKFRVGRRARERADRCGAVKKKRIDFLWVRYETSDGDAIVPDAAYASAQIVSAGTDRGYFDPSEARPYSGDERVYSDHRALHSLVDWCAEGANQPTPCS